MSMEPFDNAFSDGETAAAGSSTNPAAPGAPSPNEASPDRSAGPAPVETAPAGPVAHISAPAAFPSQAHAATATAYYGGGAAPALHTPVASVPSSTPIAQPVPGATEIAGEAPGVLPRPYIPKPKPVIVPERTERGYRTTNVEFERAANRAWYITVRPAGRPAQRTYAAAAAVEALLSIATAAGYDPGQLWRRFSQIPLDKPLPSRALEEEMRALLIAFGPDMRK